MAQDHEGGIRYDAGHPPRSEYNSEADWPTGPSVWTYDRRGKGGRAKVEPRRGRWLEAALIVGLGMMVGVVIFTWKLTVG